VSVVIALWAGLLVSSALGAQPPASVPPSPSPAPSPAALLEVPEPGATFGEVYQGAVVSHRFAVRNRGERPVRITGVSPISPRARAAAHPDVVPPGGEGYVEVEQPTEGRLGLASFRFALRTDDGPDRRLSLTGFIQSAYEPDQPALDLGSVSPGGSAGLELFSREVDRLEVRGVEGAPAFLSVDTQARTGPVGEGVAVTLRVAQDAPLGFQTGTVRLRTSVAVQPEVLLVWRANVYEDVVPSESPLDLGVVREGQKFAKLVRLERRSGAALQVERVEAAGADVTVAVEPCPEPKDSCRAIRMTGTGPAAGANLGGTLTVTLKDARPLTLPFSGIRVGPYTTVKDLGELSRQAEKTAGPGAEATPPPSPPAMPAPVVGRPGERWARLTWEVRQEQDSYGYLVYRADRREGPFRRINRDVLKVSSGPEPHTYTYTDDQVAPGHTYYYYLESIGRGGTKSRLSGVMTKVIPEAPR
jgi:uncharacterized protein DUF1573